MLYLNRQYKFINGACIGNAIFGPGSRVCSWLWEIRLSAYAKISLVFFSLCYFLLHSKNYKTRKLNNAKTGNNAAIHMYNFHIRSRNFTYSTCSI